MYCHFHSVSLYSLESYLLEPKTNHRGSKWGNSCNFQNVPVFSVRFPVPPAPTAAPLLFTSKTWSLRHFNTRQRRTTTKLHERRLQFSYQNASKPSTCLVEPFWFWYGALALCIALNVLLSLVLAILHTPSPHSRTRNRHFLLRPSTTSIYAIFVTDSAHLRCYRCLGEVSKQITTAKADSILIGALGAHQKPLGCLGWIHRPFPGMLAESLLFTPVLEY